MSSSYEPKPLGRHFKPPVEATPQAIAPAVVPPPKLTSVSNTPAPSRQHVKVSSDLAQEMRDAVWFLCAHGRPRVKLNELLDEALELWLSEAKARYNAGQDFPPGGPLR